jgi:hypothetical protein
MQVLHQVLRQQLVPHRHHYTFPNLAHIFLRQQYLLATTLNRKVAVQERLPYDPEENYDTQNTALYIAQYL